MTTEHPTKKGSIYIEDNGKWYHSKKGRKIPLERASRVSGSVLEDVLIDYNLEKGDIVPTDKVEGLFNDLKEEDTGLDRDYRICFLYKEGDNLKLGYSSKLIEENGSSFGDLDLSDEEFKVED